MKRLYAIGVSLTLASVARAANVRSCYTGQVSFSIVDPSDGLMCGDGSGGEMKSESCSTGICGHYEYEDEQCVYMVGFCSHATTVIECEDSIRLEREDEGAPDTMLARRLGSQQSGEVMRRVVCCESTDCNAKALSPKSTRKLFADRSNRKLLARRLKKSSSYKYKSKYKYKSSKYKYKSSKYKYKSSGGVYYSSSSGGGSIAGAISGAIFFLVVLGLVVFYCVRKNKKMRVAIIHQQRQSAVQVQALYRGRKARMQYAQRMNNVQYVQVQAQPVVLSGTPVQAQVVVVGAQPATTAGAQPAVVYQPATTAGAQPAVVYQPAAVQPVVVQPTM